MSNGKFNSFMSKRSATGMIKYECIKSKARMLPWIPFKWKHQEEQVHGKQLSDGGRGPCCHAARL